MASKKTVEQKPNQGMALLPAPDFRSRTERLTDGKALRESVPRKSHGHWQPHKKRADPVEILEKSNYDRLEELIPIRYGRMLRNPFTFLRGAAGLMAYDLADTPNTGIRVQACGDCHLSNFGLFATPERNLVFDINDFDETLPAPWEWDVKRLAVSFAVAAGHNGLGEESARSIAVRCVRAYRERLRAYSKLNPLEVWYDKLDADTLIKVAPDEKSKKRREQIAEKARERIAEHLMPKLASVVGGRHRLLDQPPALYHVQDQAFDLQIRAGLEAYRVSLSDEKRVLFDRYRLEDFALKVVGIGSVGTRTYVGLFFSEENHPLLLQFKEARRSVLEPYAGNSSYDNQGQRVVMGQRLIQNSSDIFLGWARGVQGHDFYVRQLRDMKLSVPIVRQASDVMLRYAEICGWTLARAHARSGDAATISGYLGKADSFDKAIGDFAMAYAEQNERDHAALVDAARSGRVKARIEEDE